LLADAILEGLNPEQREAVTTTEGPLLVLAGAGSGKTRVLTHRIAWLIGVCGIAPEAIIAVTFTNKAAGEMRERVAKLLGPDAAGVWVATFHSTCVRILRREIHHLGREPGFVIYDETDSLGLVREALRRGGHDARSQEARRVRWRIDEWKNAALGPADVASRPHDFDDERLAPVYATYETLLAGANALDFNDLLLHTVRLFNEYPEVLRSYQERWQYVLVDEYQDTNRVQYELVNQLAAGHRNLCVVGDPDQSIYAWRGADVRNILDFERGFAETKVVKLERNYRSTEPILAGAGAVVAHNIDRKDKQMRAERGGGEPIRLFKAADDRDEAQFVVQGILEAVRGDGRPLGDHAIFYRTNAQSRPIEEELLKYDVPYVVVGGVRFYDRAEVKDALAYLRLVVNRADAMALRRIVNNPPRGIGKGTLSRAEMLAAQRGSTLYEGLRALAQEGGTRSAAKVNAFFQLFEELADEVIGLAPAEALAVSLERSGYLGHLQRAGNPDAEGRIENLRELIAGAEDFESGGDGSEQRSALEIFLDQVALVSDLDQYEDRTDRVSLMTAHSSKGLEFPIVFLVGMEEGVFPHSASARDERGIEEERRLCYVGMTRAMERLTLTWALERRRWGSHTFGMPSRFLREIPESLVTGSRPDAHDRFGGAGRGGTAASGGRGLDYSYGQGEEVEGLSPGARVRHPIFGSGTVVELQGSGPRTKLRIRFERAGVKTLVLRFANLEHD
jgi:DNA helicase-2/ATP-dependent DNA helicase PcrA